jgi:hypothetical protein
VLCYEIGLIACHPKEFQDVPGTIVRQFLEELDCSSELGDEHM